MTQLQILIDEISIQLSYLNFTVDEINLLLNQVGDKIPTNIEKAASAQYISQFYNGIENILKRIIKYHNYPLPKTEDWHTQLLSYFDSNHSNCKIPLFETQHIDILNTYRKIRHIIRQGYHFSLDWDRFIIALQNGKTIFNTFENIINAYINNLKKEQGLVNK